MAIDVREVRDLLEDTISDELLFACDLIDKVKSTSSDDPSARYQIAAIAVFLAGVDKLSGLACELAAIAGKINVQWLKPMKHQRRQGVLACGRGLTKKLHKLGDIGAITGNLDQFVDSRNWYFHSQDMDVGYKITFTRENKFVIKPVTPGFNRSGTTITALSKSMLRDIAAKLVDDLVEFFSSDESLQRRFDDLLDYIDALPVGPVIDPGTPESDTMEAEVQRLNRKHVGEQWKVWFSRFDAQSE